MVTNENLWKKVTPEERSALTGKWLDGYKPNRIEAIELIEQFRTREVAGRRVFAPVIDDLLSRMDTKETSFRYDLKEEGYRSDYLDIERESDVAAVAKMLGHEEIARQFRIPFPMNPTASEVAGLEAAVFQKTCDAPYVVDFLFIY